MASRLFAIGDIHGCHIALDTLIAQILPEREDTVVILGDIVDRGPGSAQAIEMLLGLSGICRLILIGGNHEEMMLAALADVHPGQPWLQYGGIQTLQSYGGDVDAIPEAHLRFLRRSRSYHETPRFIFTHAGIDPRYPLDEQSAHALRWQHLTGNEHPLTNGKMVVCGHTPQVNGMPSLRNGWLCLDTCAFGGGPLTAVEMNSGIAYQSDQQGRFLPEFSLPIEEHLKKLAVRAQQFAPTAERL